MIQKWKYVFSAIAMILVILLGVIGLRTLTFPSKQPPVSQKVTYPIDSSLTVQHLSEALQIPTVSNAAPIDTTQFTRFREFLEKSYPAVHATLQQQVNNQYNLIYIWKGSDPTLKPILLMAHYDVFAITDSGWKYPPFSGTVAEGYIWGRGAIDDKTSAVSMLEAMEFLAKSGFRPTRTIYLALGQDEEGGGRQGAQQEAAYFKAQGLQFEAMIDEGMITAQGAFPGLSTTQWVDLIGTEEKGFLNLKLTAHALSGHSSMPPEQTSVGIIAAAVDKLERHPFPTRLPDATADLFTYLGPETRFPYNLIFANTWLFEPLLQAQLAANPKTNSMVRTTTAPDVFNAGNQPASMPETASAVVNFRLLPGETMQSVTEAVRQIINDPRVTIEPVTEDEGVWDPPVISNPHAWAFQVISQTVREVMPDVLVTPSMVTGATDGRYFANAGLSANWYRTLPMKIPLEDLSGVHGVNERILVSSYLEGIQFYIRLIQNFSAT